MKDFTNFPFVLLSVSKFLLFTRVTGTSSNIHSIDAGLDRVQLLTRQDDSGSSEFPPTLLNDSSIYPSFPSTESLPESTSTSSSINFSVLGEPIIQDFNCLNCTAQGGISLESSSASSDDEDSSGLSFIAAANGISAHVEIEASLKPRAEFTIFEKPIAEFDLDTIELSSLVATPKIIVSIFGSVKTSAVVDVAWGFDVVVPDDASIKISGGIATDFSATIAGFNDTQITQLPFSANISEPEVDLTIGLRFNFLLAVSPIIDELPSIYAGVYLDLPAVFATFMPVTNVNANCEDITSEEQDVPLQFAFPNLLTIVPGAYAAVGATAGLKGDFEVSKRLATVELELPSQCLEWDTSSEGGGVFGAPDVEALTGGGSETATASATGTAKGGSSPTSGPGTGNTATGTSRSSPSGTSGAAAETSSNGASNISIMSNEMGLGWVVGLLTLVLVLIGAVL